MSRSKSNQFTDEQLKVLLCTAGYGPLSRTDLSEVTNIKPGNLTFAINDLLSHRVLKSKEVPERISRGRGRPREYLTLSSYWTVQEICDELEFRKNRYEADMRELEAYVNGKAQPNNILGLDESGRRTYLSEWGDAQLKRIKLGAADGSFSSKAVWAEVDGHRTIIWHRYDGIPYALREISYQGVSYWLRQLQNPALKVLRFLIDNGSPDRSKKDIAKGTGLEITTLSRILPRLEARQIVIATGFEGQYNVYKLNKKSRTVKELMIMLCLWKGMTGRGLRGIAVQRSLAPEDLVIVQKMKADLRMHVEQSEHYFGLSPQILAVEDLVKIVKKQQATSE